MDEWIILHTELLWFSHPCPSGQATLTLQSPEEAKSESTTPASKRSNTIVKT